MSKQHAVINAKFDDRIIFIPGKERGEKSKLRKILREVKGTWKDHPVFGKLTTEEIIKWLRGPDSDV